MKEEKTPDTDMKLSLRVKQNVLLFLTALVMCFVYEVRHEGKNPWADGMGAFFLSWLGSYVTLIFVLLLVFGTGAVTDKLFFGEGDSRTLSEKGHQVIIYACITVMVLSLCVFLLWKP